GRPVSLFLPPSSRRRAAQSKPAVLPPAFCGPRSLSRDYTSRFPAPGALPSGAALERVLLRSRVLVAEPNSKPRFIPGLFCGHGTLTWDYIPGYSAQGPHPFGAALKRVLLRSRVLRAEPNSRRRLLPGLCWGHGTRTWAYVRGCSPQGPHPSGAALKRALLRSRVLVAEPNSKPRFIPGLFCGHGTLTWDYVPGYSAQGPHPFG